MKENSVEEITFVENKIKNTRRAFEEVGCHVFFDEDLCKAIEHILSDYIRVLKENEELKETYKSEKKMKNEYVKLYQDLLLREEVIPIQKVKEKMEEILNNGEYRIIFEGDAEFPDKATRIDAQKYIKLEKLQELLEGRKENV